MDKKPRKYHEKKADKDRGDKTNLIVKVFEELDIADFLPNRDRGDSKANVYNKSSRNMNPGNLFTTKAPQNMEKKKKALNNSEVKLKKEYILDSDDSSKHQGKKDKDEKKRSVESKNKYLPTIKDVLKSKTTNKVRAHSDLIIKSKPNLASMDDTKRIDEHCGRHDNSKTIDEKLRRVNENIKLNDETKINNKFQNLRLPPGKDLKYLENVVLERRKLLRQRYTVKLKNSNKNVEEQETNKSDILISVSNEAKFEDDESEILDEESVIESPKDILLSLETTKFKKAKDPTHGQVQRKPIIKTIRNNDHRVYKAVTFIDQKETTPLQIKMPNSKKSAETNTWKNKTDTTKELHIIHTEEESKRKEKPKKFPKEKRSSRRIRKRPSSPALTMYQGSPQTEVAKWAPSSINQHTKPYYEAWVDTTLAAITKCSEKDKLKLNKQHIIKTFKRTFELENRPSSPCLIYEKVHDEKYMGRIKVNRSK